jgi:putative transposase
MVTCGTYLKQHHFAGNKRLGFLCDNLLELAAKYGWILQAWAAFSNHYHFVALSPPDPGNLRAFQGELHPKLQVRLTGRTATRDGAFGTSFGIPILLQRSYYARLSYVHRNAVHHGLVREPSLYPWCSAGWFQRRATTPFYKTIMEFGIERLKLPDGFEVEWLPDDE